MSCFFFSFLFLSHQRLAVLLVNLKASSLSDVPGQDEGLAPNMKALLNVNGSDVKKRKTLTAMSGCFVYFSSQRYILCDFSRRPTKQVLCRWFVCELEGLGGRPVKRKGGMGAQLPGRDIQQVSSSVGIMGVKSWHFCQE